MKKKFNPYKQCPCVENSEFLLRLVEEKDAEDLLECYAQPSESVVENSFNCNMGYDAQTVNKMRIYITGWRQAYFKEKSMIRWSIVDKRIKKAVGTVEFFSRRRSDFFDNCGILRLDLQKDYENKISIIKISELLFPNLVNWFNCRAVVTKVAAGALERKEALTKFGFAECQEKMDCGKGKFFDGFWILDKIFL